MVPGNAITYLPVSRVWQPARDWYDMSPFILSEDLFCTQDA